MNMTTLPGERHRLGVAAHELLVVLIVLILLLAVLAPVVKRLRGGSGDAASLANLMTLQFASEIYGGDFDGRQWTPVLDDAGTYGLGLDNPCSALLAAGVCPPQFLLGWSAGAVPYLHGYYLPCGGQSGTCVYWTAYRASSFDPVLTLGSFRIPNAKSFHDYVDGRFYSEIWYAPTDFATYEHAAPYFSLPDEFTVVPPDGFGGIPGIWYSSYCFSPAAMWHPHVLGLNESTGGHYNAPSDFAESYASPSAVQAAYPDLKTRMIEHNWNGDPPQKINPNFAGGYTPYFFNGGLQSTPLAMFFDGHVAEMPMSKAVADDARVLRATRGVLGLWSRDTPLGTDGYHGSASWDGTLASQHILTTDGILGRDVLDVTGGVHVQSRPGELAPAESSPPSEAE